LVSYGVPLSDEEIISLDEDPDAKPDVSTPELKQVFEIIFRFWNSEYGRLSYHPRTPFDNNCGCLWIGKTLESVVYADVSDAHVPCSTFVTGKKLRAPPPVHHHQQRIEAPSTPTELPTTNSLADEIDI